MEINSVTYYKDLLGTRHIITYGEFNPFSSSRTLDYYKKRTPLLNRGVWCLYQGTEFKLNPKYFSNMLNRNASNYRHGNGR